MVTKESNSSANTFPELCIFIRSGPETVLQSCSAQLLSAIMFSAKMSLNFMSITLSRKVKLSCRTLDFHIVAGEAPKYCSISDSNLTENFNLSFIACR